MEVGKQIRQRQREAIRFFSLTLPVYIRGNAPGLRLLLQGEDSFPHLRFAFPLSVMSTGPHGLEAGQRNNAPPIEYVASLSEHETRTVRDR